MKERIRLALRKYSDQKFSTHMHVLTLLAPPILDQAASERGMCDDASARAGGVMVPVLALTAFVSGCINFIMC